MKSSLYGGRFFSFGPLAISCYEKAVSMEAAFLALGHWLLAVAKKQSLWKPLFSFQSLAINCYEKAAEKKAAFSF
jgi:hypothetical protein